MEQIIKPEAKFNIITHDWTHGKGGSVGTPRIVESTDNPTVAFHYARSVFKDAFARGEYELREAREGVFTHTHFYCVDCSPTMGLKKVKYEYSGGTGYATYENEGRRCYACAVKRSIQDAKRYGKAMFYLFSDSNGKPLAVGDWSGTFKMRVTHYLRNGAKTIVWFNVDGQEWRGINNGDDDLVKAGKKRR